MIQWEILYVRSLCSLPSLVICTVVSQVAVLPSYNSMATVSLQIVCQVAVLPSFTGNLHCCKSGRSAPFLQQWGHSQLALLTAYSNFIPIYPNLFEFCRGFWVNLSEFEWKESVCEKVELCVSAIISHIGLAYILDSFSFILPSEGHIFRILPICLDTMLAWLCVSSRSCGSSCFIYLARLFSFSFP